MAKTNWQDPKTSEMRSTHISGLQEAVGKIEEAIGIGTASETNISLTELFIDNDNRYKMFQAPEGKRNWLLSPAPAIKKNGVVITSGFEIDYGGGAIILNSPAISTDKFTVDVTYTTNKTVDLYSNPITTNDNVISLPSTATTGQVRVTAIKGRTLHNKQGATNSGSTYNGVIGDGVAVSVDGNLVKWNNANKKKFNIVSGHKYYIKFKLKDSSINLIHLNIYSNDTQVVRVNNTSSKDYSIVYNAVSDINNANIVCGTDVGNVILDYSMVYDLTDLFGNGNEPSVEWCNINLNYVSHTKSTVSMRLRSVARNLVDILKLKYTNGNKIKIETRNGIEVIPVNGHSDTHDRLVINDIFQPNKQYTLKFKINSGTSVNAVIEYTDGTQKTSGYIATGNNGMVTSDSGKIIRRIRIGTGDLPYGYIEKDNFMLYEGTDTSIPYEPFKDGGKMYVPSVGGSVGSSKDEIRPSQNGGYEHVKRVGKTLSVPTLTTWIKAQELTNTVIFSKTLVSIANDILPPSIDGAKVNAQLYSANNNFGQLQTADYLWLNDIEGYAINTNKSLQIRVAKSKLSTIDSAGFETWLKTHGQIELTYQLAQPIITPIEVEGEVQSFANGTIFIDPYIARSYTYNNGIVLDKPVSQIDKIKAWQNNKWVAIANAYSLSSDGKTLTITDATNGHSYKIYAPIKPEESTNAEVTIKVPINDKATLLTTNQLAINNKIAIDEERDKMNAFAINEAYERMLDRARLDSIETRLTALEGV